MNAKSDAAEGLAAPTGYTPSLGARMWVQVAKDFGAVVRLLPEEDRQITLDLLSMLWSGDADEATAAENTLYEIIDDPPGHLVSMLD